MAGRHTCVRLLALAIATMFSTSTVWAAPLRAARPSHAAPAHRRATSVHSRRPQRHAMRRTFKTPALGAASNARGAVDRSRNHAGTSHRPDDRRPAAAGESASRPLRATRPSDETLGNTLLPATLVREQITPLMGDLTAEPLSPATVVDATIRPASVDRLSLLGIIEAPARNVRLAVFAINGRVVHGRIGDLVGDRYRVQAFTQEDADLIDVATDEAFHVVPTPPPAETETVAALPAQTGALRVIGQPDVAAVYVDGTYVGTVADIGDAPAGLPLEPGSHHVELQTPEQQLIALDVRIDANRTTTYRVPVQNQRQ
jgi:hypothetical protein